MLDIRRSNVEPVPDAAMRSMFAARKTVFIDQHKWNVPALAGLYELDQFDDVHANYLILFEPDGRHLGSARLLPTTRPHILDGLYPGLCDDAPPRGPDIFEITRFCLDPGLSPGERRRVRNILVTELVEHALACGISAYSTVVEIDLYQQVGDFGWHCRSLGTGHVVDGRFMAALLIEIGPETPALLAAAGIVREGGVVP